MNTGISKTIAIVAVVGLLTAASAHAQRKDGGRDWPHNPPSAEEQLLRISNALNLDSEQSVQLLVVLQEQAEDRAALRQQVVDLIGTRKSSRRLATQALINFCSPSFAKDGK